MNWTPEQKQAIEERNKNILVAAAAGSGKTAVLVERIKKLVIDDNVPINQMLIVTFTNAAASEMKEKIRKSLREAIEENPEDSALLRQQLSLLPRANISTFHAFALEVIRNYFHLCDLEPGFSICDEAQGTILKEEALDLLFETEFAHMDEDFKNFLDWYSTEKSMFAARNIIMETYRVLQSYPYPWKWLDEHLNNLKLSRKDFEASPFMEKVWDVVRYNTKIMADTCQELVSLLYDEGLYRMGEMFMMQQPIYNKINELAEEEKFDEIREALGEISSITLRAKKDEKEAYEMVKEEVTDLRYQIKTALEDLHQFAFYDSLDNQISELNMTYEMGRTLERLLKEYDVFFKSAKRKDNLVDFNDIEHYCLDILNNPSAAQHYRDKFQCIFIDEYQDTNIIQEEIISKIRKDNNLFMVGDIKQSIYKFRLAEPSIFKDKYHAYSAGEDEKSVKIDLNKNYRSKRAILKEINKIFKRLMEGYDDNAKLYPGLDYDGEYNFVPRLKVVDMSTLNEADDEIASLKTAEIEALSVAKIIKENLGREFYDSKAGINRKIELRDIVILMRSIKGYGETFYKILKEENISALVDGGENYFDTIEIAVFMNLLNVIDNKYQDVPLISLLYSEIFAFSPEELSEIRIPNKEESFAKAFIDYCEEGDRLELVEKAKYAFDKIEKWKIWARSMPLPRFIWELLLDSKYYIIAGAMPAGAQRQANLRALVDKAEYFSNSGQASLYSFMKYIEAIKDRQVNTGQVKLTSENEEIVRIMTIHKSKGLEFPMVIVAGLGKRLRGIKGAKEVSIHKDLGISLRLISTKEQWYKDTILERVILNQINKEEWEEDIRVLYVALTRAKDILYLSGTVQNGENYRKFLERNIIGDSSFLEMIGKTTSYEIVSCDGISLNEEAETIEKREIVQRHTEEIKELRRLMEYTYPYGEDNKVKSKYTVSELNKGISYEEDKELTLAVPRFKEEENGINGATRGTIYHGFMERLDFVRVFEEGISYIKEMSYTFLKKGIFLEEEVNAINYKKIVSFVNTDIGQRCVKAAKENKLYKETPFNLIEELDGEKVIVQGIIDCYFQEGEDYVLLDYKTNWIDRNKDIEEEKDRIRKIYEKQMKIYAKALEKATGKKVKETYLYLFSIEETAQIELEGN